MSRLLALTTVLALAAAIAGTTGDALAQAPAKDAKAKPASPLSGFGGGSKEPYKIDANKLEVQQSANKATYVGDVVVIQGKTTMRCSSLVIFFDQKAGDAKAPGAKANPATAAVKAPAADANQPGAGGLKRLECHGPVSILQEKQTATANLLVYESDIVTLTGSVIMADGDNVQAGEKLVYNTKTGIGTMEGDKDKGRVRGIFLPGGGDKDPAKKAADKKAKTG